MDNSYFVRYELAANPSTPECILEELAFDPYSVVKMGIALNPSTPDKVINKLALDSDEFVRKAVDKATKAKTKNSSMSDFESKKNNFFTA